MKTCQSILITLIFFLPLHAQHNSTPLLRSVYNTLQKAKDYTVQAHIKVEIPFIRMEPVDVKIFFKQKDKFKVESQGIAMVPRQGFDQASKILADTNSYTSILQGEERIGIIQTKIVNVIPLSDTSDIVLAKFWIDPQQSVIVKSQLTTRSSGTIVTDYKYGSQIAFGLPDEMTFWVDVKKFKAPKGTMVEVNKNASDKDNNGNKKGKISIVLTNYQVNKGIADSIFKK